MMEAFFNLSLWSIVCRLMIKNIILLFYFLGRYNKYSRTLPQTPWVIDGERKMESSVEELITEQLMAVFKADSK